MRIAIVHDFLREYGGAERVVEILHEIWPEAPIFTAFVDYKGLGPHAERIRKWDIRPSWVQNNFIVKKFHSPLRFLAPKIWESFDFTGYDVIISSASWFITKGIIKPKNAVHICYLHSVPRALYGYETRMNWQKHFLTRIYGNIVNHYLRNYDFESAQKVDYFIANSMETARRIKKFYRRESTVIYPPVEIKKVQSAKFKDQNQVQSLETEDEELKTEKINSYYLCVSRLARAKHIELAIRACNKLRLPLYIIGKGIEEKYLKSIAGPTIEFFGEVDDKKLAEIYRGCKALIFPAVEEDFGIVPVEAMGFGKPVIAYKSGGVTETVVDGRTGVFFEKSTEEDLEKAISKLETLKIDPQVCIDRAEEFSRENFVMKMKKFVEERTVGWVNKYDRIQIYF